MYYCDGYGFWVLSGDATTNTDAPWRPLTFEHDNHNYSSYLTNAGNAGRLRCQRPEQQWPRMLLPDIYQSQPMPTDQRYGGLKGDLAILLALIALSMGRENLQHYLPSMFTNQRWQVHGLPHGRRSAFTPLEVTLIKIGQHQRGVVVYIYTCPPTWPANSTSNELHLYENGQYMPYYN